MRLEPNHIFLFAALLICVVFSVAMASYAYYTNQGFGFPLDDPWIHLQFARNLVEYGSFSYYQDEMVTSGSTAPLYTLLLAAGFLMTQDEMLLSYFLGVLFFLSCVLYAFKLIEHMVSGKGWYAFLGALLVALEPRLHWIALSGMETTLFVALSLAVCHYYRIGKPVPLGISAGLLLWTRPEAVILFGAILADLLYRRLLQKQEPADRAGGYGSSGLVKAAMILAIFGIGYAAFNLALSGSILPNTYAAKLKYYSGGGKDFSAEVFRYLTAGHLTVFSVFAGVGAIRTMICTARRRQADGLIPLLFASGLFFAYWIKLPYLYQNGRYMMPVLPFVLMLGFLGLEWLLTSGPPALTLKPGRKTMDVLRGVVLSYAAIHFAFGTWQERVSYQDYCAYINGRQVRAAHWIRNNLPDSAVVATHDVGALAFYSNRRIVDMVGLVSPEMIDRIGNLGKLTDFLIQNDVTHLALLRNWFEVVNVTPLYQTSEQAPEILEIFAFDPGRVHFTAGQVAWLTSTGWLHLARGDLRQAGPMLERAVQLDPKSSRARHHFGWALLLAGQPERADDEFRAAVGLYPEYWLARFARAEVALRRGKPDEALGRLKELLELNPRMAAAHQAMAQIYSQQGDTARARVALDAFRRLEGQNDRSQLP